MAHAPTPQQQNIYDAILHGEGHLIIKATAGSGKTTTIVNAVKMKAERGDDLSGVLFVAFNKSIVNELKERLPAGTEARTMHACGMAILADHIDNLSVKQYKYSDIIKDLLVDEGIRPYKHKDYREVSDSVKALVNHLRLSAAPPDLSADELLLMLEDSQDDFPKAHGGVIVATAMRALEQGVRQAERRGEIDFTDMLYLPWRLDLQPKTRYDMILLDEAQDQNALQRWLVLSLLKPTGRLVAVGDPNQAIYGFAGADSSSMDLLQAATKAESLPLSVSWRCPSSHVKLAQAIVGANSIQAAPTAASGAVDMFSSEAMEAKVQEGDVILARANRPLIEQAFAFIRAGRRAKVRGKDIGDGLARTLDAVAKNHCRHNNPSKIEILVGLNEYKYEKEEAILQRGDLNEEQRGQRLDELSDRVSVLELIIENSRGNTVGDVKTTIAALFDDSVGKFILLSTIHKAKGLEFDNVFLLNASDLPAEWAMKRPVDAQGEMCVLFVALTRAKKYLGFVDGLPRWPALQDAFYALADDPVAPPAPPKSARSHSINA